MGSGWACGQLLQLSWQLKGSVELTSCKVVNPASAKTLREFLVWVKAAKAITVPSSRCNSVTSEVTPITMTPRHLSLSDVLSNMSNICHLGFFLCGLYCHLRGVHGRTGCNSEWLCFSRTFKIRCVQSNAKRRKTYPIPCSWGSYSAAITSDSQCLQFMSVKCLQTFLCSVYHTSLLQAPKDWIRSCNCLDQDSLRRKKFIIMFNISFLFFSWSQLVRSRLTTTLPMTDQNSGVQTL